MNMAGRKVLEAYKPNIIGKKIYGYIAKLEDYFDYSGEWHAMVRTAGTLELAAQMAYEELEHFRDECIDCREKPRHWELEKIIEHFKKEHLIEASTNTNGMVIIPFVSELEEKHGNNVE